MAGLLTRRPSALGLARAGAVRVWRHARGAVIGIWAIVAALSVFAIVPAAAWWTRELGPSVETARVFDLRPSLLLELIHDNPAAPRTIVAVAAAAALLAVLLNPFFAGGLLGRLAGSGSTADGPVQEPRADGPAARFAADGVRYYAAMLATLALVSAGAVCVALIAVPVATSVAAAAGGPGTAALAAMLATAGLVTGLATIVLDLARIHVVRGATRNPVTAIGLAIAFAITRGLRLASLALIAGLLVALAGVILLQVRGRLAGGTWPALLGVLTAQQIHALARTWIRAAWLAGELVLVEAEAAREPGPSVSAGEERPEVFVVVEREAGEGGLAGDERLGGADLAPEVAGGLTAEGDAGRRDAGAGEPRVDGAVPAGDRGGA
jgi:hypothetical protein